ncbi:hypothetical protein CCP2SC5_180005 [Azospirillaceae bacterium]
MTAEPNITQRRMRAVAIIAVMGLATSVAACGRKPAHVDPPIGVAKDSFPQTYPKVASDPQPEAGKVPMLRHDRSTQRSVHKDEKEPLAPELPAIFIPDPLAPLPTPTMPSMVSGGAVAPQLPTLSGR